MSGNFDEAIHSSGMGHLDVRVLHMALSDKCMNPAKKVGGCMGTSIWPCLTSNT